MALEYRRSEPIPGFQRRLKQRIALGYPSVAAFGEASGLKTETLWSWICGRATPTQPGMVAELSDTLGVSMDWLLEGVVSRPTRDAHQGTLGARVRLVLGERYGTNAEAARALEVWPHILSGWALGHAVPHLLYLRRIGDLAQVSLDWLWRGEAWAATATKLQQDPATLARAMAARALGRMAARAPDPEVKAELHRLARAATRRGRSRRKATRAS